MAARNKPYEQFGTFILFKQLEGDALGDLWRAGRIAGGQLGPTIALRRLSGGNREAMSANARAVAQMLPHISGTSFVRDQRAGVIDAVPYLEWEYGGGRSLRHIIDRARGGKDGHANPLPIDQAIVIAEKIALSLSTMADLRDTNGARLSHGALIPQFVWISDDGEIRVAGQQLGPGLMASLSDPNVGGELGRYFSPEYRSTGQAQKAADVYSMGAILFLLVTGQEPPDSMNASAFGTAVRAAKTMMGALLPDDIRVVLDKSLNIDPSMRYASMADMKQAISGLVNSGRYSATTFNLAFYLSSLLKRELESEAADREKESKIDIAAFLAAPKPPAPAPVAAAAAPAVSEAPSAPAMFTDVEPRKKSKAPLAIAAAVVLALLGVGGYMMLGKSAAQPPAKAVAPAQVIPKAAAPRVISEPIAVTATPATATAATTSAAAAATDSAADQQKAFEEAVRQKLHAEMMKLQNDFMSELKQKQARTAPVDSAPVAAVTATQAAAPPAEERPKMTAAQLDQQRRDAAPAEAARTATTAPLAAQTVAAQPAVVAPPPVQKPAVREGDVVDVASLDAIPRPIRPVKPQYPPLAARQRIAATIIVSVFVTEDGEVTDVKVLRGDARFGLNDAAIRAMRGTRFSPPMKDGKRVRTWFPQSIEFRP